MQDVSCNERRCWAKQSLWDFFSPRSFCVLVLLLLIFCFDFPTDALYSNIWNFDFSCISTKKHVQVQLARNLLPVCKNFRFLVTFPTPYPLPSLSSTLPLLYTVRSVQALSHSGILFSGVYKTRLHAQTNNENQTYECIIIKVGCVYSCQPPRDQPWILAVGVVSS